MMSDTRQKGFVITVDALLSLAILFAIFTLGFQSVNYEASETAQRQSMAFFAQYAGETLETSRIFSRAVITNNTTDVRTFLNAWPSSICGSIAAYANPDTNQETWIVSKSGCASVTGEQETIERGIMVPSPPDANLFVAKISVWVNRT